VTSVTGASRFLIGLVTCFATVRLTLHQLRLASLTLDCDEVLGNGDAAVPRDCFGPQPFQGRPRYGRVIGMPSSVVSVINYKGGVGKTTLTANLGAELAARGRRVLLIDLDPQASLTFSFFRVSEWEEQLADGRTILQWFESFVVGGTTQPLQKYVVPPPAVNAVVHPDGGRLDLLASHLGLIEIDLDLAAGLGGSRFQKTNPRFLPVHRMLADALREQAFAGYDAILIDCAPNFNMVTRTAIVASDHVLVPARPDYLSTLGIDYLRARLSRLVEEYNGVARSPINPEIVGVVYTMIQYAGTGILKAQRASMERMDGIEIPVFRQTIRENKTAFTDAGDRSVPVVLSAERTTAIVNLQYELQQLTSEFIAKTRI
jgi:chromosome partitioning protein